MLARLERGAHAPAGEKEHEERKQEERSGPAGELLLQLAKLQVPECVGIVAPREGPVEFVPSLAVGDPALHLRAYPGPPALLQQAVGRPR